MGSFRDYEKPARSTVREFYRLNHEGQTLDFVRRKKKEYLSLGRMKMTMWEVLELLDTLVDDSDPDIDLSQIPVIIIRFDGCSIRSHAVSTFDMDSLAGRLLNSPAVPARPRDGWPSAGRNDGVPAPRGSRPAHR